MHILLKPPDISPPPGFCVFSNFVFPYLFLFLLDLFLFLYSFNPHVEVLWYSTMAQFDLNVLASASVTLGVAALALVCRLVARRMTKMSLWFDDYFAIFAFVCPPDFQMEETFSFSP
jgi:hypothetical protein